MQVFLEAIKFNHDPNAADKDALNIRKNETEFVTVPEWRRGISVKPEDSPAAYAICETRGNQITIQAKVSCTDPSLESIEVRAIDGRINPMAPQGSGLIKVAIWLVHPFLRASIGNLLGDVRERPVFFCQGESKFETFEINNVQLWDSGVRVSDTVWRWQFRTSPSAPWIDFAISNHRIYALLKQPTLPWKQDPYLSSNSQLPWREVLDYACNWADSTKHTDDAATNITKSVYNLGPDVLRFSGNDHYITPYKTFDATAFLEHLQEATRESIYVNCTDCASIVSTFANILGCDLFQSRMSDFRYNPIRKIGESSWTTDSFDFHDVAWEGDCGRDNDVFDACLQIDGDPDPTTFPHTPFQPSNLRFGSQADRQYHFRLVAPSNPDSAQPRPTQKKRRPVGKKGEIHHQILDEELLERLKLVFEADSWRELKLLTEDLFISELNFQSNLLAGWNLQRIEKTEPTQLPRAIKSIWQPSYSQSETLLRLDSFECASLPAAHDLLLEILTQFQSRELSRREAKGRFGDIVFASHDNTQILFARANLIVRLRNIQKDLVSLTEVATQVDDSIIRRPSTQGGQAIVEMDRFEIFQPDSSPYAFLRIKMPDPFAGLDLTFKFFSKTGEVSIRDGHLVYRSSSSENLNITVFVLRPNGAAFRQVLSLSSNRLS
jgi:hypothetical protein